MTKDRISRFEERFKKYYPLLCNIAHHYIKEITLCEDVVQDLLIKVWNKEKDYLPEDDFLIYVTTAVRNNSISYLRKQQKENTLFIDATNKQLVSIQQDSQEDKNFYSERLQKILLLLPPKCREVFVMSKIRKMKYKEIAEELDISEKTVENHIVKAYKLIREYATTMPCIIAITLIKILYIYKI